MHIKRVIASNSRVVVGYDEFNQFCKTEIYGDRQTSQIIADVRGRICVICQKAWTADPEDLINHLCLDTPCSRDEYDKARFCHDTCYLGHLNINERSLIIKAIHKARNNTKCRLRYQIDPIPNEYRGAYNTDWYMVGFPDSKPASTLKFGSRKRVWVLELAAAKGSAFDIPELHPIRKLSNTENTTNSLEEGVIMFHAWTEEKVAEYLSAMVSLIEKPEKSEPT